MIMGRLFVSQLLLLNYLSCSASQSADKDGGDFVSYPNEWQEGQLWWRQCLRHSWLSFPDYDFDDQQRFSEKKSCKNYVKIIDVHVSSIIFRRWSSNDLKISFQTIFIIGTMSIVLDETKFDNLFDYPFRLYEVVQLNFVHDTTSAGMEGFCQGLSDDIEHCRFESLIWFQIARLGSVLNLFATVMTTWMFVFSCIFCHMGLQDLASLGLWSRHGDQPARPLSRYRGCVKVVLRLIWTSSLSSRFPRFMFQRLCLLESSGRQLLLICYWGLLQTSPHRFQMICAVMQSHTTETLSSFFVNALGVAQRGR